MAELAGKKSWTEELASLVEETGVRYTNGDGIPVPEFEVNRPEFDVGDGESVGPPESLKDQVKGFAKAWGEIVVELGRGCKDVVQQSFLTEDSYVVKKVRGPWAKVSGKLRFLNEFLPEDRDPIHAWPVIFFVFILALSVLSVNTKRDSSIQLVLIHPPSAKHILLPDGRKLAYREQGVLADRARFSMIAPHSFLSSRLAGIPGVNLSLLQEFGVRLVTYDLPGFGESDPHLNRSLHSSALDILHLADALEIKDKFWVLGYSSAAMHAWAALKYIPSKIAGAAMFAPMVNPYEPGMTREEKSGTWDKWTRRRKLLYYLARRFPRFLSYFYHRSFLSGKHGPIEKWLSLSLEKKDKALTEDLVFKEFWHRDVEESIRQGNVRPFIEEASLLVSNWPFSVGDLRVQKKCPGNGIFPWFNFMYNQAECELVGFLGPIHIWQGMDDQVVPSSMVDYITRVLPSASVHKLPEEGHFSYFYLCNECHRSMLLTLFGKPEGPLETIEQTRSVGALQDRPSTDRMSNG